MILKFILVKGGIHILDKKKDVQRLYISLANLKI
jgi:hypothetical protein